MNTQSQPKKKKLILPEIWLIVCGIAFLVLTLIALITKNCIFNYILVGTGIMELIIAFSL